MPTAVEDVLELSPPARGILADMEVRRRGCLHAHYNIGFGLDTKRGSLIGTARASVFAYSKAGVV